MKEFRKLTPQEVAVFREKMTVKGTPVRFMVDGQAVDIVSGKMHPKGTNVMYQPVYWCFNRKTALEIAEITGAKAVFS